MCKVPCRKMFGRKDFWGCVCGVEYGRTEGGKHGRDSWLIAVIYEDNDYEDYTPEEFAKIAQVMEWVALLMCCFLPFFLPPCSLAIVA